MSDWQELDSVPRDGSRVLLFVPAWDLVDATLEEGSILSGRYDAVLDHYTADDGETLDPTHWRPLLKPPPA